MINKDIIDAFTQIAKEKNVDRNQLGDIIQDIFKNLMIKKYGEDAEFDVIVNMDKGELEIYHEKTVVDEVEDPGKEISLEEAQKVEPDLEVGELFVDILDPSSFGRRLIANAKQNLFQQIRDIEKMHVYNDYKDRIGEIIMGDIHQVRRDAVFVNIEKTELKMPRSEQIRSENYRRGMTVKAIIKDVVITPKGPDIIISRADSSFLRRLFELEVPEIYDDIVEINKIAREPGDRAKVIVESHDRRVDAVGACVGMNGSRIQAIVRELNNEKIDVIDDSSEIEILLTRALSPAKPLLLEIDEENRHVQAIFDDDEIAIAIGRNGQNIRLASQVTGYEIDAVKYSEYESLGEQVLYLDEIDGLHQGRVKSLMEAGIETVSEFINTDDEELLEVKGLGKKSLESFAEELSQKVDLETGELLEAEEDEADEAATDESESVETEEPETVEEETAKLEAQEE
ncbi:MAG: transcription termination factor NusA [Candidatus Marinimicrobia bacterium]|nr:transcription termination factor NusA [Candidatus Neomarinimicrobiota bacterium]MCF7880623.1 transcription termination factor NusA [Candidatus Neomarinimicrobiota bacterium]